MRKGWLRHQDNIAQPPQRRRRESPRLSKAGWREAPGRLLKSRSIHIDVREAHRLDKRRLRDISNHPGASRLPLLEKEGILAYAFNKAAPALRESPPQKGGDSSLLRAGRPFARVGVTDFSFRADAPIRILQYGLQVL